MSTDAVVIGLGSNLKNKIANLRLALKYIKNIAGVKVSKVSAIYESSAQVPEYATVKWNLDFLNAAVLVQLTDGSKPDLLLSELKNIEKKMGRVSTEVWEPRIIDLDILFWEGVSLNNTDLKIPHPRLLERPFALLPLLDVYPEVKLADLPTWANAWVDSIPFNTQKSSQFFWPQLVGVVNLTVDSFSDGNENLNLSKIDSLLKNGVDVIELGAESTRPGANPDAPETEWQNLKLAFDFLNDLQIKNSNPELKISIDSCKPAVIEKCLEHFQIDFINDVTGFRDLEMKHLLKISGKKAIVMHSLSVPPKQNEFIPADVSPADSLLSWWKLKKAELLAFGINQEQLIFDPGIGFGKTKQQNLFLLKNLQIFYPILEDILIGHSRKSYQCLYSDRPAESRDLETALVTADLNLAYTQYMRLHDLETQKIALRFKA